MLFKGLPGENKGENALKKEINAGKLSMVSCNISFILVLDMPYILFAICYNCTVKQELILLMDVY